MITTTLEFSLDELKELKKYLPPNHNLASLVDTELEKLSLVDMSDWNDCGDACKL